MFDITCRLRIHVFHPNGTIKVESTTRNLFTPHVKYVFSCADIHEIHDSLNVCE